MTYKNASTLKTLTFQINFPKTTARRCSFFSWSIIFLGETWSHLIGSPHIAKLVQQSLMSDVSVVKKEHSWCFQPIICSCAEFPLYKYTHQPRFLKSVGVCIQRRTTWFNKPAKTIFAGKLYMASAFWLYNKTSLCSLESTEKKNPHLVHSPKVTRRWKPLFSLR